MKQVDSGYIHLKVKIVKDFYIPVGEYNRKLNEKSLLRKVYI